MTISKMFETAIKAMVALLLVGGSLLAVRHINMYRELTDRLHSCNDKIASLEAELAILRGRDKP